MQAFGLSSLALATMVTMVTVLIAGAAASGSVEQAPTPTVTARPTPRAPSDADIRAIPGPRPVIPALSAEQQEWLTELALNEPRVQDLLADQSYEVWNVAPWHTSGDLALLGGGVELRFDQPVDLEGEFLGTNFDCSGRHWPPYQVIPYWARVVGAERLYVMVELERAQVVGLFSFPGGMVDGPHITTDIEIWPRTCPGD